MGGPYHILPTSLNTRRAFMQERKTHACVYMRFACVIFGFMKLVGFLMKRQVFLEKVTCKIFLFHHTAHYQNQKVSTLIFKTLSLEHIENYTENNPYY